MECKGCGNKEFESKVLFGMSMGTKIPFPILVCKECGLVYSSEVVYNPTKEVE